MTLTATMNPPAMPAFRLGHPEVTPRFAFSATMPDERLDEKYRPRTLAEVVGQGAAVFALQTYLDAPHSTAFLFEGPSGVGKTSAARALANDLGVDPDWGFEDIKSARADMDSVDRALRMLRHVAPGSGWKLVLVDEADLMTPKAAHLWLSALEDLPPKSVIVFTTNRPEHFPDRFLDRCERIRFDGDGAALRHDAQALIDSIWQKETGSMDDSPSADDLPNLVDSRGVISFRRAVLALGPLLRARRTPMPDGRPTVAYAAPGPVARPDPAPIAPVAPAATTTRRPSPSTTAPAKPAQSPRKRPTTAPVDVRTFDDDDDDEADLLLEQSEANAEVIRKAREILAWAGDRATPTMRAALKEAEAEDARLVKRWLAVQAERAKRSRAK